MLCYCGAFDLAVEDATYVKDSRPMCHPITCLRVGERNERAARRAPFYDDLGNEHFHTHLAPAEPIPEDNIGSVYGKCRQDGQLVFSRRA